jgi:predicted Zn finger-like uncharacterized protein
MRFTCDRCQAPYRIADEKVRGRMLRVRCKRCGHEIYLREAEDVDKLKAFPFDIGTRDS